MRFIGNHPIPEHVNPPEDLIGSDDVRDDRKPPEAASEETQHAPTQKKRGRRSRTQDEKPGNREAA